MTLQRPTDLALQRGDPQHPHLVGFPTNAGPLRRWDPPTLVVHRLMQPQLMSGPTEKPEAPAAVLLRHSEGRENTRP